MSQQELSREVQEVRTLFKEIIEHQGPDVKSQPYTIFIENLRHPPYCFRHPIPVLIERDGDTIIATYHDVDIHGTGGNVQEALDDLCAAIIEYYERLKADYGNLSKNPSQEYAILKQIIKADPWLEIRGIFANDPDFDYVMKEIDAHRKELNEAYWKELDEGIDNE